MNNVGKHQKCWKMSRSCGRQVGAVEVQGNKWELWKSSEEVRKVQERVEGVKMLLGA